MADDTEIAYEAGAASVVVDAAHGARLASLRIHGHELLVRPDPDPDPLSWGCYPMVPWAGRVADGGFDYEGERHRLPIGLAPHAIHGTGYLRPWLPIDATRFELELAEDWPFGGRVVHEIELEADHLTLTLEVHAGDRAMPAMAGWHPWFVRSIAGANVELRFRAAAMYERSDRHLPTGRLITPSARPWDDCFVDVTDGPALWWPEVGEIELTSTCDHWVVYDEPTHAICVEPQTGPPDEFNRQARVVQPGDPLRAQFTIRWEKR